MSLPRPGVLLGAALRSQVAAGASVSLGALQLALLLATRHPGEETDSYFVVFTASQIGVALYVQGIVYPRQLAARVPGRLVWRRAAVTSALLSILGAAAGFGYRDLSEKRPGPILALAVLLGLSGAAAAVAASCASGLSLCGRAAWFTGVAVPANLGACTALLLPVGDPVIRMCAGLLLGNVVMAYLAAHALCRELPAGVSTVPPVPARRDWLSANACVGWSGGLAIQAAAATLAPGTATVFAAVSRVGLAVVGVGVNGVLPAISHWRSDGREALERLAMTAAVAAPVVVLVIRISGTAAAVPRAGLVTLFVGWLLLSATAAVSAQLAFLTSRHQALRTNAWLTGAVWVLGSAAVAASGSASVLGITLLAAAAAQTLTLGDRSRLALTCLTSTVCLALPALPFWVLGVALLVSQRRSVTSMLRAGNMWHRALSS